MNSENVPVETTEHVEQAPQPIEENRTEQPQEEEAQYLINTFDAQTRFVEAVFSGKYNFLTIGGSIRSGKTYVCLAILIILARIFPKSKWVVIRHDLGRLRRTTLQVFHEICPENFIQNFNNQTFEATFINGSKILFLAQSDKHDVDNRIRGLYINGVFADECNELKLSTYRFLKVRLGSHTKSFIIDKKTGRKIQPPAIFLGSLNPCQNWAKSEFYLPFVSNSLPEDHYYQPITIRENPHIDEETLLRLKKSLDEDDYQKFIEGSWDITDSPQQLIPWKYINQCNDPIPFEPEYEGHQEEVYLGVDPATTGDDRCVYTLIKGSNIINPIESIGYVENVIHIANRVKELILEYNIKPENIVIDSIGEGAGVAARLHEDGIFVNIFKGSMSSIPLQGSIMEFRNLRAQSFWLLKEKLKEKAIGNLTNPDLKSELAAIEKNTDEKYFKVESKDDYKARNSKSPDLADSLCYACWAKFSKYLYAPIRMMQL